MGSLVVLFIIHHQQEDEILVFSAQVFREDASLSYVLEPLQYTPSSIFLGKNARDFELVDYELMRGTRQRSRIVLRRLNDEMHC
jgi:hypothetical protein